MRGEKKNKKLYIIASKLSFTTTCIVSLIFQNLIFQNYHSVLNSKIM